MSRPVWKPGSVTRSNQELATHVAEMNATLNQPRGVSMLRSVIFYLERDLRDSALNVLRNDKDKLWQYDIEEWTKNLLRELEEV